MANALTPRRWSLSDLSPAAASVGLARRELAGVLGEWEAEQHEWVLTQLVSELATNVVLHAGTPFAVTLTWDGELLRAEVSDDDPRPPRTRSYAVDATTGRGMRLVERLSRRWGVERRPDGKTVWFELDGTPGEDAFDVEALLAEPAA